MSGLPKIVSEVNVTDEDRSAVLENANTQHTDNDRDRTHDEQITSSKVGLLGERLFKQAIERTDGLTFESAKTEKVDGYINTHPVEVKTRKTWDYSHPDLLVRMNFDLEAKFYLQVDLYTENNESVSPDLSNVTHGEIVGYVTQDEVRKYGTDFMGNKDNKKNKTLLVDRSHLEKFHRFQARIV